MMLALLLGLAWGDDSALADAVARGDAAAVTARVAAGDDPNGTMSQTYRVRTGFLGLGGWATRTRQVPLIDVALEAALRGRPAVLEALLAAGADPQGGAGDEAVSRLLRDAVADGVSAGSRRVFRLLLAAGARPTAGDQTLLSSLPATARIDPLIDDLLAHGVGPDAMLCGLAHARHAQVVLAAGADPDALCGATRPLAQAAAGRDLALLEVLLDAGADASAPAVTGRHPGTALHAAAQAGWDEGVARLLDAGADPTARVGPFGPSVMEVASPPTARLLASRGVLRTVAAKDVELWSQRPVQALELGPFLRAWAAHGLPLDGVEGLPGSIGTRLPPSAVDASLRRVGAARFDALVARVGHEALLTALTAELPSDCGARASGIADRGDARQLLGRPDERRGRSPWRWSWGAVAVDGYRVGLHTRVRDVWGLCDRSFNVLIGLPREAVWLALGEPDRSDGVTDLWTRERRLAVDLERGVAVRVGLRRRS